MKFKLVNLVLVLIVWQGGCREADVTGPQLRSPGSGTYIVNEGVFAGGGNLSFFDPASGAMSNDVVVNPVDWLFPNDILFLDTTMYVAVNGADRIDVIDPETDSVLRSFTFPAGRGPGFLAEGGNRLYCANYDGTITAIDPAADSILGSSTRVVGFPGDLLVTQGKIFVTDLGSWPDTGRSTKVLDQATLTVIDSIVTGGAPSRMALSSGKLYIGTSVTMKIWRVDLLTLAIEDSCDVGAAPGDLAADGTALYVLTPDAVERIPLGTFEPDPVPLIPRAGGIFHYAMDRDDFSGELYVSTITTGGGSGEIAVFTSTGIAVRPAMPSGIFPGAFGFYRAAP